MMNRCYNPNNPDFHVWGGRGIKVCERWHCFLTFVADTGTPPEGMTLDRIDVNGDYEPSNTRWADSKTQGRNKQRHAAPVEFEGKRVPLWDIADRFGLPLEILRSRLSSGLPIERAVSFPRVVREYKPGPTTRQIVLPDNIHKVIAAAARTGETVASWTRRTLIEAAKRATKENGSG
jgi:hypothetical protein